MTMYIAPGTIQTGKIIRAMVEDDAYVGAIIVDADGNEQGLRVDEPVPVPPVP